MRFGLTGNGRRYTLREVGERFGVNPERARQIQNVSLLRLREARSPVASVESVLRGVLLGTVPVLAHFASAADLGEDAVTGLLKVQDRLVADRAGLVLMFVPPRNNATAERRQPCGAASSRRRWPPETA